MASFDTLFSGALLLRGLTAVAGASCALALAACGSGGSTTSTGAGGAGTSTTSSNGGTTTSSSKSASSSGASMGMMCPGMGYAGGTVAPKPGGSVTATIVDQNGMPVAGQPVYICGTDICSPAGMTGASGQAALSTMLMEKKPAFKFGDRIAYAELGVPLTMATTALGTVATAKLPTMGAPLTPGMSASNGGVTIAVPAGATLVFDTLIYDMPDKQTLRAAQVPVTNLGPVLPAMSPAFEVFYGVSPSQTTICPAATVTVQNTAMWPANTKVEFWVMTLDVGEEFAPYAGWAKMSDGTVSSDGKSVSTDPGAGFIYLDNFAIRKK